MLGEHPVGLTEAGNKGAFLDPQAVDDCGEHHGERGQDAHPVAEHDTATEHGQQRTGVAGMPQEPVGASLTTA